MEVTKQMEQMTKNTELTKKEKEWCWTVVNHDARQLTDKEWEGMWMSKKEVQTLLRKLSEKGWY